MAVKDFCVHICKIVFKKYYKQICFTKEDNYYSLKESKRKYLVLFATNEKST